MTRPFSRWECPKCGHHIDLYIAPSEPPPCCHVGTVCNQRVARMVPIVDVTDADRAELEALVKGQTPERAKALARAWSEGRKQQGEPT